MSNCCEREVIIEKIWIQKLNSPVEIKHVFLLLLRTKYILLMRKLPISVDVSAQGKFATLYIHVCSKNRDKLGFGSPQLFIRLL